MDAIIKDIVSSAEPIELSEPAKACAEQIMHSIQTGQLKSPQRIGETSIAKQYGVGRAHVRTALDHLAYVGILDRRARSGTYIRKLTLTEYVERIGFRGSLEGLVVREACSKLTPSQVQQLKKQAEKLDSHDCTEFIPFNELRDLDMAFHMAICEASGNSFVESQLRGQRFLLRCFVDSRLLDLPVLRVDQLQLPRHTQIVAALRKGSPDEAERVMKAHIFGGTYYSLWRYLETLEGVPRVNKEAVKETKQLLEKMRTWLADDFKDEFDLARRSKRT